MSRFVVLGCQLTFFSIAKQTGKEGPVSDCIACSLTSVMFGMRLRSKGETQLQNVSRLMDRLPNRSLAREDERIELSCDRGYGKMSFVEDITARNMNIVCGGHYR